MTQQDADSGSGAWEGRFLEDLQPGHVFRSRLGRTVTESDNLWFTMLTLNTNQVHFNQAYAERTTWGRILVNSCLTLSLISGLTVSDTSENAIANLAWTDIRLPHPVFVGDTLWAETEILEARPSASKPGIGIVGTRTRGLNQHGDVVIEFMRTFMIPSRASAQPSGFPRTDKKWAVGPKE